MKISYRTHPILEYLHKGNMDVLYIPKDPAITSVLSFYKEEYIKKIQYLTNPFRNAIKASTEKLIKDDVFFERKAEFGTLLNFETMVGSMDVCYAIQDRETVKKVKNWAIFYFYKNLLVGAIYQNEVKDEAYHYFLPDVVDYAKSLSIFKDIRTNDSAIIKEISNLLYTQLIAALNFIKYAEVETKVLPANKVTREISCKYVNDTMFNITRLDSTWFTNLVKSDAFKVRGHLRLQPKKIEGKWTRELIWIKDFIKNGYTRKAGILAQETEGVSP